MKTMTKVLIAAATVGGMTIVGMETASALSLITARYSGNDCSGVFGRFAECYVSPPNSSVKLSPIIAKFDVGQSGPAINTNIFPTVSGQEWSFSPNNGRGFPTSASIGSWTYNPGPKDPAIKYWVAKGGNAFNLFFYVNPTHTQPGGVCHGNGLTSLACFQKAVATKSGVWQTPPTKKGNPAGLSHISFYGERVSQEEVPEPLTIMGSVLALGLGWGMKQQQQKRKTSQV
ncbi:MAG: PEP-CTERM sorting domain-containing protein [Geminocystis sp.]|nr:PEP-CTERM sorting domain-containing protein [Geminocystis sp.]MCS7147003.1 PEP-CTERM sorting domain-containing protein [Geminocystis sp.]MCX8077315.1 PEP-CTERM sorting domain-containing protein [Geminocystis sp.]MDW8115827.1 PEP-CTERM sorting domain-containing protein [Geminocystis sp.]